MLKLAGLGSESDRPLLSIVIPALNESANIGPLLEDLAELEVSHEVVVVDGGSTDATRSIAAAAGARVFTSPPGRGAQLRAGADAARASLLCFLHADVRLDLRARQALSDLAVRRPAGAFAFRLRIDEEGIRYRLIEIGTNSRSRYLDLPYGDQGLIVRREDYGRAGGYPSHPLMEDVALVRALRQITPIVTLDASLRVSARRWRREGAARRTIRNLVLLLRYLTGTPPERLSGAYQPEPPVE